MQASTDANVIGAGFFFLASGCGPALNAEERKFLPTIDPAKFYPLSQLLEIFRRAEERDPNMIHATGRRWGSALKGEWDKMGLKTPIAACQALTQVYQGHHQGEIGKIVVEQTSETSVVLRYDGPYPHALITGAFEAVAITFDGEDVTTEPQEQDGHYGISWTME